MACCPTQAIICDMLMKEPGNGSEMENCTGNNNRSQAEQRHKQNVTQHNQSKVTEGQNDSTRAGTRTGLRDVCMCGVEGRSTGVTQTTSDWPLDVGFAQRGGRGEGV